LTIHYFSAIIEDMASIKNCSLQKAKIQYNNELKNGEKGNSVNKLIADNDGDNNKNLIKPYSNQYCCDYFSIGILINLMKSLVSRKKHDY